MSLGQFVKQTQNVMADSYVARDHVDRPLIVFVREYKTGMKTKHAQDGSGEGVVVDVLDLMLLSQNQPCVFINVLWMGTAVRDQLKNYVPQPGAEAQALPIMLQWQTPQGQGMQFISPVQLEGDWLQYAASVHEQWPTFVSDERNRKMAQWQAEAAAAGQQQNGQPQGPPLPALSGPAPQVQQPVAQAPPVQAPVQAAPVAAPPVQAPVAAPPAAPAAQFSAPPVSAPPVAPQAPVAAPAMTAPQAPPAPPVAAQVGPPAVTDADVQGLLDKLNA